MNTHILVGLLFTIGVVGVVLTSAATACTKPTIPPGSTWVSNVNCTSGPTYNQTSPPKMKCHCYAYCGYICDPSSTATATTTTTTTPASTACTKPTIPNGSTWVPNRNCTSGNTYTQTSPTRANCHCYARCGYICDPI